ncbi:helix-turn-helix transcriptional regulator [Streptomyces sp. NPDC059352]|uniref:helix-turn-helix domain-containing protein n=1 Tax=Streptomyces sp. NPDC059352 TaxID=3346810 RepID=UPI0036CB4255
MLDSDAEAGTLGVLMRLHCLVCADHSPHLSREGTPLTRLVHAPLQHLTPMEQRVFTALRGGPSNEELALRLRVTPRTTKFHVTNLRTKLGGLSRLQLCLLATLTGMHIPALCPPCACAFAKSPGLTGSA